MNPRWIGKDATTHFSYILYNYHNIYIFCNIYKIKKKDGFFLISIYIPSIYFKIGNAFGNCFKNCDNKL